MNHEATLDGAKGNILLAMPRITLAVIVFITHVLAMSEGPITSKKQRNILAGKGLEPLTSRL